MAPNTSTKYDLEKFDGSNDFSLWRMKMRAVLIQQGLLKALKGKQGIPDMMSDDEKEDMMHDGIVRTLTDVRHVPELRKNMISLGTLDSNGCSYRATGGVMRIMKGALVVMKGLKQNNSDTSKLWHMHLGHMSERGMDVLSKQGLLGSMKTEKLDFYEHCVFRKQIFGCLAYAHVNHGKLELKAKKCIFLGYTNGVKGYQLWCPDSESSRFLISRDVTFDESSMLSKKRELIDAGKDHSAREKVELEVRAPDSLSIILTDKEDGSHSTEENEEPQE
ncbi:hypothetical protein RJ639_044308 [Escallonia herrerae]|uniref:GAG-pre-integrase domain-containing protein n=1 Tax=Escallonia herrerae TaxID=1293975 RepID=A0AA89B2U2_9ASTE|nr:hypothetical protein RJ639_044308 [Escallonia herrerae]